MKILLPYRKNCWVHSIVNSTAQKLRNSPIDGVSIEIINLDNRKITNYFVKKLIEHKNGIVDALPSVIYVYKKEKELIEYVRTYYSNIRVVVYSDELVYKPARVPGNELPTVAYFLADKIRYDITSNYETRIVYYADKRKLQIVEKEVGSLELNHPYSSQLFNMKDCYKEREEAVKAIKTEISRLTTKCKERIDYKKREIEQLNKQINEIGTEIENLTNISKQIK